MVSRFNSLVTTRLLEGAQDTLVRHGASPEDIDTVWVPGAWELPVAAQRLAQTGRYDAVIALGAVIRGETPHFEFVATQASTGLAQAALATGIPISFGVLTTDTLEQGLERAGGKAGNKGAEAAVAALEMASLLRALELPPGRRRRRRRVRRELPS